jgi:hypothetical protein
VVARETVELCESTKVYGDKMVEFGSDISATVKSLNMEDASEVLETMKRLTDGKKLKQAMKLASQMDDIAISCIDKSVKMMDMMEDAMDALPEFFEDLIDQAAEKEHGDTEQEVSLTNLDRDIEDVQTCIEAIGDLNLVTAFSVGSNAFEQLSLKATQSKALFHTISGFSSSVAEITEGMFRENYRFLLLRFHHYVVSLYYCPILTSQPFKILMSLLYQKRSRIFYA